MTLQNKFRYLIKTIATFFFIGVLPENAVNGCVGRNLKDVPNILWISVEDLSPIIGAYGDKQAWTPNIDGLADEGVLYTRAYAASPICSPSRSSLITGISATSLGTQQLRSDITIPDFIKTVPEYLGASGYYTTNNSKTDYNFSAANRWDENSDSAHWRNRPSGRPFFSVFNFMTTHEGRGNDITEPEKDKLFKDMKTRHSPDSARLPPYFPQTPEMRRIWAHYYDLTTVMDKQVGYVLSELKKDGLEENTIVVFFSDHGTGLPRYKRWPYQTGLHVPLIIRVPPRYRHLIDAEPGTKSHRLVSLVDLAPSMLKLAKVEVPSTMQGIPFLGEGAAIRKHVEAFRSRADDVFELSRTVIDDEFIYIRNFMPHQPWVQQSLIFAQDKDSYRELLRVKAQGGLPPASAAMFAAKPLEELYHIHTDPYELRNLALSREHETILQQMRTRLRDRVIATRDTDFLPESDMMARSEGSTPYEMAADTSTYNLSRILDQAEKVGNTRISSADLRKDIGHFDSGVRYWAALALLAKAEQKTELPSGQNKAALRKALYDSSAAVQITAAEGLCYMGEDKTQALYILARHLQDKHHPWVALQAASSIRRIGEKARPLASVLNTVRQTNSGDKGKWGYRDWLFSMFIGFAVDQALINIGAPWETTKAKLLLK